MVHSAELTGCNWIAGKSKIVIMRAAWRKMLVRYASARNRSERAENA